MKIFLVSTAFLLTTSVYSQKSIESRAKAAERRWAAQHPFIASGCLRLTKESLTLSSSVRGKHGLDSSFAEGTFDAFRHGYWMARLSQRYAARKVILLGEAHEASNYHSFRIKEREHGVIPDKANGDMDLWNNRVGAEIGARNKNASPEELQQLVLDAIFRGEFRIIKKSPTGAYLDCEGNAIPPEKIQGTWENPKCLVPSNSR